MTSRPVPHLPRPLHPPHTERVAESLARHVAAAGGDLGVEVVVALSGGYSRQEANDRLSKNAGMIASFSRALTEGLSADQSDAEFESTLAATIESIYQASISG